MSYEQRLFDGVLHWRVEQDAQWNVMSADTLTVLYMKSAARADELAEQVDEMDKALQEASERRHGTLVPSIFPPLPDNTEWPFPTGNQTPPYVPDVHPYPQPWWVPVPTTPVDHPIHCGHTIMCQQGSSLK